MALELKNILVFNLEDDGYGHDFTQIEEIVFLNPVPVLINNSQDLSAVCGHADLRLEDSLVWADITLFAGHPVAKTILELDKKQKLGYSVQGEYAPADGELELKAVSIAAKYSGKAKK